MSVEGASIDALAPKESAGGGVLVATPARRYGGLL